MHTAKMFMLLGLLASTEREQSLHKFITTYCMTKVITTLDLKKNTYIDAHGK